MPTTIQVGSGRNQETDLDKLLKGIALANQGLGIYSNIQGIRQNSQQYDLNKQKLTEAERHGRGEFTAQEYAKLGFDISPIVQGAPQQSSYKESPIVKNGRTVSPLVEVPIVKGKLVQPDGTVAEVNLVNREMVEKAREKGWKELTFDQKDREIEANRTNKEEAKLEKGVEALSDKLEKSGLSELGPVAERLKGSLRLEDDKYDIPGFGQTYAAPDVMVSREGQLARQDVGALRNIILKARSGGAVTPQEAERMLAELGEGYAKNDDQLRSGVKNVLSQLAAKAETIKAGVPKGSVEEFKKRGGPVPEFSSKNGGFPRTVRNGNKMATVSNEQELKEAQSEGFR